MSELWIYVKGAWRSIAINRTYAATNLIGLTIGLAVVMCIATLVCDDLSYDKQWTLSEELYTINSVNTDTLGNLLYRGSGALDGLGSALKQGFPDILDHTNLDKGTLHLVVDKLTNRTLELTVLETDTNFFNLFDTHGLVGHPKQLVTGVRNLVITESLYREYFDGAEVVGETFYSLPRQGDPQPYVINAIIRDLPQNTHLRAQAIQVCAQEDVALSPHGAGYVKKQYLRIRPGSDIGALTDKTNAWFQQHLTQMGNYRLGFEFQPIADSHLRSPSGTRNKLADVYLLGGIGLMILALACVNYVNLSFAHAVKRTLEMGVRKTFGAQRNQLMWQSITENLLFFSLSLAMAALLYLLIIPGFEAYLGYSLTKAFHRSPILAALLFVTWLGMGLLCGLAPAWTLASTKTSYALKKQMELFRIPLKTGLVQSLIVVQFAITMVVMAGMFSVRQQLTYMLEKDLGYEPDNLLVLDHMAWEGKSTAFKQALLQQRAITNVSLSHWAPRGGSYTSQRLPNPSDPNELVETTVIEADFDFLETIGFRLLAGRALDGSFAKDDLARVEGWDNGYHTGRPNALYTETAASRLGASLNRQDKNGFNMPVGIVQDFHLRDLRNPIGAVVIYGREALDRGSMLIRVAHGGEKEALAAVTATWNRLFPDRLPRVNWADDMLRKPYQDEQRQFHQLLFFSGISMLLALLGVFGIVAYTVERKVREIGIRKVLGASAYAIVSLLSANFVKLVGLAALVAFPIAWWSVNSWLENFAYRIGVPWWLFALTGVLAVCSMFLVVGGRALQAATANPVDSLRDE